jgi:threonine/homoserine/homoserine lactone efflux protein
MDPSLLGRAAVLGFTIAAAVGPIISLLTVRRTLEHGRAYGLASGIGVALADATYAAIAAFGLSAVTSVLVGGRTALGVIGGAFIVWLAFRTILGRPAAPGTAAEGTGRPSLVAALASIYALTITNPMTILSFVALFAAIGLAGHGGLGAATVTVGVFAGSVLWWLALTSVVGWLRGRVTWRGLLWVNRVSGGVLLVFGLAAIGSAVAGAG